MTFPNGSIYPQSLTLRDAKGFTGSTRVYINETPGTPTDSQVTAAAWIAAVEALSNAAPQSAHGPGGLTGVVQYGAQAEFLNVEDQAEFLFQDTQGGLHRYRVPAPKAAIFFADLMTVNPGNGLVAAFVAVMTTPQSGGTYICSKGGEQIINFFGGLRVRARNRRRYGFLQLSPALTPEEPGE